MLNSKQKQEKKTKLKMREAEKRYNKYSNYIL